MSKNFSVKIMMPVFISMLLLINTGAASWPGKPKVQYKDFMLHSLSGETVTLAQFKGNNPVLLVFFATWCPPCKREVPQLKEMQNKYADRGLKILAIDIDEPNDIVREFVKEKGINYTVLLDEGAQVAEMYDVSGIPTNILFDRDGNVRHAGHALPSNIEDVL